MYKCFTHKMAAKTSIDVERNYITVTVCILMADAATCDVMVDLCSYAPPKAFV